MTEKDFLHSSNWTKNIVNKFAKHIHHDPEECYVISDLALTSGVVDLWEEDIDNLLSLAAWFSTTDSLTSYRLTELRHKIVRVMSEDIIFQALRVALYAAYCLRNHLVWSNGDDLLGWDKEIVNYEITSRNINLQGTNLEEADFK